MADLVGDDIGLGEVAGRAEAILELPEKGRVEIDPAVAGAIEGTGRRSGAEEIPPENSKSCGSS
jgi:hypothetical protein